MTSHQVTISLSPDEALVLFDWLSRTDDQGGLDPLTEDHAERVALSSLAATLEDQVIDTFDPAYAQRVRTARLRLTRDLP
ncbi:hypothetical protein [Allokutzneria sp. NRRL B-24872]|uniref:hypothetical protein n=1 Tax=Allokutzneria sp. NRRL B-24872 TaxID=1137961 RepID=UPI000A398167|nr:hypothetical protein [Allokutzneria sp. NRRL B-24872]